MLPVLFRIGPIPIYGYGFMIAMGFLTGLFVTRKLATRSGLDAEKIIDLSFWGLILGFVGARALFIITRFSDYSSDPLSIFRLWEGGFVFFGGPMVAMPFGIWYMKKHRLPIWKSLDTMMPGLVLGHSFGRIGCLAAGCCYGKPTGTSWGIKFHSDLVEKSMQGINLHPTQLYEASALFTLFLGLLWVYRHRKFDGQVALTYFMAYPIIRSIIETFRGDLIRGFVIDGVLSTSQFISILAFGIAAFALIYRLKQIADSSAPKRARAR